MTALNHHTTQTWIEESKAEVDFQRRLYIDVFDKTYSHASDIEYTRAMQQRALDLADVVKCQSDEIELAKKIIPEMLNRTNVVMAENAFLVAYIDQLTKALIDNGVQVPVPNDEPVVFPPSDTSDPAPTLDSNET